MKAIVFDFDGLIIDTETVWYLAFKEVLQGYNVDFPLEVFVKCIGTDDAALHAFIEEKLGVESIEIIMNLTKENHKAKMELLDIREGVKEYLIEAQNLGLKIGLASSSSREWVEGFLKQLQILDYFEVIKTGDEVEKVKPDPTLYIKTLEALNINADEAVAFEDSANGARAAIAAGLKCVIVPNEVTKEINFEKFHLRINSMSEMSLTQVISHLS
ncbi:HAD family hydrolase [Paenibacillus sp. 481]|uniref:HAD family hydrolase n=1 Tax=Paenibacillus sp. 481 TaxID=2835869 RepID=UPI001E53A67B|nr:HAD family hydrolase [Paenibacillus sp. 481]UHA75942.1 HAD family hydrolase [Paenibacillus sp. 481]